MAAAIATWIRPKLFTQAERDSAIPALIVGATVATEPAIPYALAAPLPMISANVIAGGVAGAISMALGVQRIAPGIASSIRSWASSTQRPATTSPSLWVWS